GVRVLHRLRQVSHVLGAVTTLGDRALTLAYQVRDLMATDSLVELFPPVRVTPRHVLSGTTDALERAVTGHLAGVWAVAWTPDGRRLASAGHEGIVRIWALHASGQRLAPVGADTPDSAVAWWPPGSSGAP